MAPDPGHDHLFLPGSDPTRPPLVLLHGSGRGPADMLPIAAAVAPEAAALSVRGAVPWEGGHAFFRRFPDRTIDEADLRARVPALAAFVAAACRHHRFARPPVLVGFSNGAIMAAALALLHPGLVAGAVLMRPLTPFRDGPPVRLGGLPVLILEGLADTRRAPGDGLRMAGVMAAAGGRIVHRAVGAGHAPTEADVALVRAWLAAVFPVPASAEPAPLPAR